MVLVVACPEYYEVYKTENFMEREVTKEFYTEDKDGKLEVNECDGDTDDEKCASYLGQVRINRKAHLVKFASDRIQEDKIVAILERDGDKTVVQSFTMGSRKWPEEQETTDIDFTMQKLFEIESYTTDTLYELEIFEDYALMYLQDANSGVNKACPFPFDSKLISMLSFAN